MAGRQPSRLLVRGSHKSKFLATSFSSSGNLWVRMSREPITPGNYSRIKRLIFSICRINKNTLGISRFLFLYHSIRVSIKGNNLCSELILYIIRIWCSDTGLHFRQSSKVCIWLLKLESFGVFRITFIYGMRFVFRKFEVSLCNVRIINK